MVNGQGLRHLREIRCSTTISRTLLLLVSPTGKYLLRMFHISGKRMGDVREYPKASRMPCSLQLSGPLVVMKRAPSNGRTSGHETRRTIS